MKLYIEDIDICKINKEMFKNYNYISKEIIYVYTPQGIIELKENKMCLLKQIDYDVEKKQINNYNCLIDKSKLINDEIIYQLPYEHLIEKKHFIIYSIRPNGLVELVIEDKNNKIVDIYLNIKDNFNSMGIKDDIVTFLSVLNFY